MCIRTQISRVYLQFISDTVALGVWCALGRVSGEEIAGEYQG